MTRPQSFFRWSLQTTMLDVKIRGRDVDLYVSTYLSGDSRTTTRPQLSSIVEECRPSR